MHVGMFQTGNPKSNVDMQVLIHQPCKYRSRHMVPSPTQTEVRTVDQMEWSQQKWPWFANVFHCGIGPEVESETFKYICLRKNQSIRVGHCRISWKRRVQELVELNGFCLPF